MLSASSVINVPPVANAALSTQAIAAPDRVSLRVTPIAVSAPLANERSADNNPQRNIKQVFTPSLQQQAIPVKTSGVGGDSSAFIAQLLSQSGGQALATAGTFSRFAPALQYNTLVSYSFVKYKPSNVGLSTALGDTGPQDLSEALPYPATAEYRAYSNTQSRNATALNPSLFPVLIAE